MARQGDLTWPASLDSAAEEGEDAAEKQQQRVNKISRKCEAAACRRAAVARWSGGRRRNRGEVEEGEGAEKATMASELQGGHRAEEERKAEQERDEHVQHGDGEKKEADAADVRVLMAKIMAEQEEIRKQSAQRDKEVRATLQRLLEGQRRLRADFDLLEHCLGKQIPVVAEELRRERFAQARHGLGWPAAEARIMDLLGRGGLARRILATAGQAAWSAVRRASRSARRSAEADGVMERHIGAMGGVPVRISVTGLRTFEHMELSAGAWEPLPDLGRKRNGHAGAVLGGRLYVCGGMGDVGRTTIHFSPVHGRWRAGPSLTTRRAFAAAAVFENHLYLLGGTDGPRTLRLVERLDLGRGPNGNGAWTEVLGMSSPSQSLAAVAVDDGILHCGGWEGAFFSRRYDARLARSAEVLLPTRGVAMTVPSMPVPRAGHSAVVHAGRVFAIAGWDPSLDVTLSSIDALDLTTRAWTRLAAVALSRPNMHHQAICIHGKVLILGGVERRAPFEAALRSVEQVDLSSGARQELTPMREARASFCAVAILCGPSGAP